MNGTKDKMSHQQQPKSFYMTAEPAADKAAALNGKPPAAVPSVPSASAPDGFAINTRPNPLSYLFFAFVDPLISRGRKKRLEPEDCMKLPSLQTESLYSNFERAWAEELDREQPDIRRAVIKGHFGIFMMTAVLYLIGQATLFAGPILLQRIVKGLECRQRVARRGRNPDDFCETQATLYLYSIGLFGAPFIAMLTDNHMQYLLNLIGTKMRNSLMAAIYRKCLRASNAALQRESTGKIVTLMSNDAQKIQDVMLAIHACWGSPLFIMAVLAMLYLQVEWATFVGLFVMLALGPLTGIVAVKLAKFRRSILEFVDKRINVMSEIIPGIRIIKFYAWESPFLQRVQECRNAEVIILKKIAIMSGAFGMLLFSGPVAVGLFCFMSYTLAGNTLTTARAYAALAYFTMLRFPVSRDIPLFVLGRMDRKEDTMCICYGVFSSRTPNGAAIPSLSSPLSPLFFPSSSCLLSSPHRCPSCRCSSSSS
jgi:ATP-binding cassette, subfamily C (CFTR/MRP), member 1